MNLIESLKILQEQKVPLNEKILVPSEEVKKINNPEYNDKLIEC